MPHDIEIHLFPDAQTMDPVLQLWDLSPDHLLHVARNSYRREDRSSAGPIRSGTFHHCQQPQPRVYWGRVAGVLVEMRTVDCPQQDNVVRVYVFDVQKPVETPVQEG